MKVYILAEIDEKYISHVIGVYANVQDAEETLYAFEAVYQRNFTIVPMEVLGEQTQT